MHNTPILHIEYHCGLLLFGFFLSLEMSSKFKGPNEVDLFQRCRGRQRRRCLPRNAHVNDRFYWRRLFYLQLSPFFSMGRCQASHVILRQASSFMRARLQRRAGSVEVRGEVPQFRLAAHVEAQGCDDSLTPRPPKKRARGCHL